jgi:hypothetical protein
VKRLLFTTRSNYAYPPALVQAAEDLSPSVAEEITYRLLLAKECPEGSQYRSFTRLLKERNQLFRHNPGCSFVATRG